MKLIIILLIIILVFCLIESKNENFDMNNQALNYQPIITASNNNIDNYAKVYKPIFLNPPIANNYANKVAYDLSNPSSYSLRETSDGEIEGIISPN